MQHLSWKVVWALMGTILVVCVVRVAADLSPTPLVYALAIGASVLIGVGCLLAGIYMDRQAKTPARAEVDEGTQVIQPTDFAKEERLRLAKAMNERTQPPNHTPPLGQAGPLTTSSQPRWRRSSRLELEPESLPPAPDFSSDEDHDALLRAEPVSSPTFPQELSAPKLPTAPESTPWINSSMPSAAKPLRRMTSSFLEDDSPRTSQLDAHDMLRLREACLAQSAPELGTIDDDTVLNLVDEALFSMDESGLGVQNARPERITADDSDHEELLDMLVENLENSQPGTRDAPEVPASFVSHSLLDWMTNTERKQDDSNWGITPPPEMIKVDPDQS